MATSIPTNRERLQMRNIMRVSRCRCLIFLLTHQKIFFHACDDPVLFMATEKGYRVWSIEVITYLHHNFPSDIESSVGISKSYPWVGIDTNFPFVIYLKQVIRLFISSIVRIHRALPDACYASSAVLVVRGLGRPLSAKAVLLE